jgi:tetratricopeptide (TPR) repeat protein
MIRLGLLLLFTCAFTLATTLGPYFSRLEHTGDSSSSMLAVLMGDSRRMFANEFFAMADAYFHSGFYPTIFDKQEEGHEHLTEHHEEGEADHDEDEPSFLGQPRDWVDRFGRHFYPTVHTHLHGGNEREILPWLKLSADLDPQRTETYITASYWLRTTLNKPAEAEQFLRQGLRANPDGYDLLLELGRVYFYSRHDPRVARNIWELSLGKWNRLQAQGLKPDPHDYEEIRGELVRADEQLGDQQQLLADLEALIQVSHSQETLQLYIDKVKQKLAHPATVPLSPSPP